MKIKKIENKKVNELCNLADQLGKDYVTLNDLCSTKNKKLAKLKDEIKSVAANSGQTEGADRVLRGAVFKIGYSEVSSEQMNEEKLLAYLKESKKHKKLIAEVTRITEVIDYAQLREEMLKDAQLMAAVKDCSGVGRVTQRILVKPI